MTLRNIIAIYSLFIGSLMIVMWTFFLVAGMVPEFSTRPAEIGLHLIAEFSTAVLLIIAGISLLYRKRSGYNLNLIGLGMLYIHPDFESRLLYSAGKMVPGRSFCFFTGFKYYIFNSKPEKRI
ncbi:MAG: hypothetical protein KKF16_03620 [Euryarchaeota archaeon]|nr:hypothetical protein [Euryarchaeota archaeon]MBV1728921.1 hypothetical protein [Methanobacterium sp.]MBU4548060.1 hypothetical protein [Euryarchaeota archaeon]MBU4608241.1 hypothetical protein [Euryarchaeota archaeon]MBV1755242.1 hypothetical protein [Methanobacterium sp.]